MEAGWEVPDYDTSCHDHELPCCSICAAQIHIPACNFPCEMKCRQLNMLHQLSTKRVYRCHSQSGFSQLADRLLVLSHCWCSFCCSCSTFCTHFRRLWWRCALFRFPLLCSHNVRVWGAASLVHVMPLVGSCNQHLSFQEMTSDVTSSLTDLRPRLCVS